MVRVDKINVNKTLQSFKGRPNKFYTYMRSLQTVKYQVVQFKRKNRTLIFNDEDMASELCSTFKDVFVIED
jgi:hypothetical protein